MQAWKSLKIYGVSSPNFDSRSDLLIWLGREGCQNPIKTSNLKYFPQGTLFSDSSSIALRVQIFPLRKKEPAVPTSFRSMECTIACAYQTTQCLIKPKTTKSRIAQENFFWQSDFWSQSRDAMKCVMLLPNSTTRSFFLAAMEFDKQQLREITLV